MTISSATPAFRLTAAAVLMLWQATPGHAVQPTKVWVANAGLDTNPCSVSQPCLTFQHAHDTVAPGGEVGVLDPGDYGLLSVGKSVSISNDGVGEAGILNTNNAAAAVTINAAAGDTVGLRGLVLDGAGSGGQGILFGHGGAVHIQNCVIRNFEGGSTPAGIWVSNPPTALRLFVSDTIILNNGGPANSGGIFMAAVAATVEAVFERVQIENNVRGMSIFVASGNPNVSNHVTVRDSTVVGNAADGIFVRSIAAQPGQLAFVVVERTLIANNAGTGASANNARTFVVLNKSRITNNGAGVAANNGGVVWSFGNNKNNLNVGPEGTATSTFSPL